MESLADVTLGLENLTVLGPKQRIPSNFKYCPCNIPGPGMGTEEFEEQFQGCNCNECGLQCPCIQRFGVNYNSEGRLQICDTDRNETVQKPIYECNQDCKCDHACHNRLVQHGLRVPVTVIDSGPKGLGLQSAKAIPKNVFVCEYAGEILTKSEAKQRAEELREKDMNYIMALHEHFGDAQCQTTYVDPKFIGNVGRFINHSCHPNLVMVPVRVNNNIPKLALFTKRDVEANEELTFSYSECTKEDLSIAQCLGKRKVCFCGSANCTGLLPYDPSLYNT